MIVKCQKLFEKWVWFKLGLMEIVLVHFYDALCTFLLLHFVLFFPSFARFVSGIYQRLELDELVLVRVPFL